jgi:hypothetical protein
MTIREMISHLKKMLESGLPDSTEVYFQASNLIEGATFRFEPDAPVEVWVDNIYNNNDHPIVVFPWKVEP